MRVRRNCRDNEDFNYQADVLIERFTEKGYKVKPLQDLKQKVHDMGC